MNAGQLVVFGSPETNLMSWPVPLFPLGPSWTDSHPSPALFSLSSVSRLESMGLLFSDTFANALSSLDLLLIKPETQVTSILDESKY